MPESDTVGPQDEEYYILCPTRPPGRESLISHLISVDICEKRQGENFHKCPGCVRSRAWKAAHPDGEAAPAPEAAKA